MILSLLVRRIAHKMKNFGAGKETKIEKERRPKKRPIAKEDE